MLDKIRYVNHLGETFSSAQDGIFALYSELRDYEWEYETRSNTVTRFWKDPKEKSFPLIIVAQNPQKSKDARHRVYEVAEQDVLDESPGKLYIGDYYLQGYVVASEKSDYLESENVASLELTFLAIDGIWRKESYYLLQPEEIVDNRKLRPPVVSGVDAVGSVIEEGKLFGEYPHDYFRAEKKKAWYPEFDYAHDYVRTAGNARIKNASFSACEFKMVIWGFVTNPKIVIGGHTYEIQCVIFDGERVEIDSRQNTITKIGRLGEKTNLFNARSKVKSVFERIPKGWNGVTWPATYKVELTLYDERSEPVWS